MLGEPVKHEVITVLEDGAIAVTGQRETDSALGLRLEPLRADLLAVARSIVLDDDEAQDVVQATLETAIRHGRDLRSSGSLLQWLLRIETREAFRLTRRARRTVRFGWQAVPDRADGTTPHASLEVREALGKLPARIRAAIVLHYMADLPVADAAAALGVSENTVKTQLKRGLALLREELGHVR